MLPPKRSQSSISSKVVRDNSQASLIFNRLFHFGNRFIAFSIEHSHIFMGACEFAIFET
jgi:hypothetical protein